MSRNRRLLVDQMCGGIVSYLRMCGYDTSFAGDRGLADDADVIATAEREQRTILTRDRALAERLEGVIELESRSVEEQLATLVKSGFDLTLTDVPERCGNCNGRLESVGRTAETPQYAPDPSEKRTWQCQHCDQQFWKGSHWDRVQETLQYVREGVIRQRDEDGDRSDEPPGGSTR